MLSHAISRVLMLLGRWDDFCSPTFGSSCLPVGTTHTQRLCDSNLSYIIQIYLEWFRLCILDLTKAGDCCGDSWKDWLGTRAQMQKLFKLQRRLVANGSTIMRCFSTSASPVRMYIYIRLFKWVTFSPTVATKSSLPFWRFACLRTWTVNASWFWSFEVQSSNLCWTWSSLLSCSRPRRVFLAQALWEASISILYIYIYISFLHWFATCHVWKKHKETASQYVKE